MKINNYPHRHKLTGFTLIETLLTIILTSLVVSIAYLSLIRIQRMFEIYKESSHFISDNIRLNQRILKEQESTAIFQSKSETNYEILRPHYTTQLILSKEIVFKNYTATDTFKYQPQNIQVTLSQNNNSIAQVGFEIIFHNKPFKFNYKPFCNSSQLLSDRFKSE